MACPKSGGGGNWSKKTRNPGGDYLNCYGAFRGRRTDSGGRRNEAICRMVGSTLGDRAANLVRMCRQRGGVGLLNQEDFATRGDQVAVVFNMDFGVAMHPEFPGDELVAESVAFTADLEGGAREIERAIQIQ